MEIDLNFNGITIKSFKTDPKNKNARHLFSEVHFDAKANDKLFKNMTIPVNQPFGEGSIGGEIEVGTIRQTEYNLPWNHDQFLDKVKEYFGMCVGPNGRILNTKDPNSINLTMENCKLGLRYNTKIEANAQSGAW
jgi:hypothetical protein